jgi:hypothetical protein
MRKITKFLFLFVLTTCGIFGIYKWCWPNSMTNQEYLLLASGIALFFSSFITYGDNLSNKLD